MASLQSLPTSRFSLRGQVEHDELVVHLAEGPNTLGSDPACDLVVRGRGVSRRHARILVAGDELHVEDLGSKNGTFHNDRRVAASGLAAGDRLRFGSVELQLEEVPAEDADLAISLHGESSTPATVARHTTTLAPEGGGQGPWWELFEEFLDRLAVPPEGDLVAAVTFLHWSLGVQGVTVTLEAAPDEPGDPVVLASCGQIDDLADAGAWGRVPESAGRRPEVVGHTAPDGTPLVEARWITLAGERLRLLVWGDYEGRARSAPLLRLLLRSIADHRGRAEARDVCAASTEASALPDTPSDGSPLTFPQGYVTGVSSAMTALYREMEPLVRGTIPVLVFGETGTGKEWAAQILHASSPRAGGPFVALNCAAIPAELAESELFGIGKGVATGVSERPGKFRLADGGTLFLDEIGEMPLSLQAKLLRTLQEGEVLSVGGRAPQAVDVRVVAATNLDLERAIEAGTFRQDLYYRLAGYVLGLPPLKDCQADIPLLVEHFLRIFSRQTGKKIPGITVKALRQLTAYAWPGNVRQLGHEVRRLVYLCPNRQAIDSRLLPPQIRRARPLLELGEDAPEIPFDARVRAVEEELVTEALHRARGVQLRAAELLGISRSRLARKMKELEIDDVGI